MRSRANKHNVGLALFLAICILAGSVIPSQASELGHFAPAMPRVRDYIMPDPGTYFLLYNLYYTSSKLKDKDGNSIDSISVGGLDFNVETNVDSYMAVPMFIYVPKDLRILGGRYAALIAQPFGNTSFQAALESTTLPGFGLDIDESSWGLGDTYIRPLWLGWNFGRFDVGTSYGIYAPTGKYDAGQADNVGLGMWTHEFMANVAFYLDEKKGTALTLAGVYEIHHEKKDVDITPGSHLSISAGISQYLPLGKKWLAELGLAGIGRWQMTEDSGSDTRNTDVKDQVYMAGPEFGLIYLPWGAQVTLRWLHEFEAEDCFEGDFITLTGAFSF